MMTLDRNETIAELKYKIRVLEEENAQLSERAEDSLLLGLIADAIENASSQFEILEKVLERISILKNIPYCTCGALQQRRLTQIATYASFSDNQTSGYPIEFTDEVIQELKYRPIVVEAGHKLTFDFSSEDFKPVEIAIIAFKCHPIPEGIFVFVNGPDQITALSTHIPLLDQVVENFGAP